MRKISKEHIKAMHDYDFMQNAFEAATVVAIVSGLIGLASKKWRVFLG
jgi:ABC-type Mn2+/Zn2+ transport system permease subunit